MTKDVANIIAHQGLNNYANEIIPCYYISTMLK